MTRTELDTFPNLTVLSRSREMEMTTKSVLLQCAAAFSPGIEEQSEDNAFLCGIDISRTQSLFGPPEKLAQSLLQRVKHLGITASVTVSRNLHAAICLAKGLSPDVLVNMLPPGEEAAVLASLPIAVLDPTRTQAETFALWGIHTLGMLAGLPENELIARMGQDGKRLRQLARGEYRHLFQPIEPPFTLEEKMELDAPVGLLESLLFVVGMMLDQLILRAKARSLALASVTIVLKLEGGSSHTRTTRPALPSMDKKLWIKLLHLDLEAHPPPAAILAVTLSAEPGSTSKVQLGLFSPQLPEAARLDVTLARIQSIVGKDCVGRIVLKDTHAPDGFRMEPFTVPPVKGATMSASTPYVSLRRLRPPEAISITLQNSRPTLFFYRGQRYDVERAYGPWLISGDWWNSLLWELEQWDLIARAHDGTAVCCCVMYEPTRNQWHMAAFYD